MKKTMLAFVFVLLVLTGCARSETNQSPTTAPTEPMPTQYIPVTVPAAEPTEVATTPTVAETMLAPTAAPTVPAAIVITKHPSSETVSAGAGTWFIARAENATQITWEFFSPDGTMYSLQQ